MMMAYVWIYHEHCYLITNTSGLIEGRLYTQYQWCHVDETQNMEPKQVEIIITQLMACEI